MKWPKNFLPYEWDCIDRGGYFGKPGSIYRKLSDAPKAVQQRACNCAWEIQVLRDEVGLPLGFTSAWRPLPYNRKVRSKDTSQHVKGWAVDIIPPRGWSAKRLHKVALHLMREGKMAQGGLGLYSKKRFVHYDPRGRAARWGR